MRSRMTRAGQVTIPKELREHLGLKPGAAVEFELMPEGSVVLRGARKRQTRKEQIAALARLRGNLKVGPTTDEIMALLRGDC